MFKHEFRTMGSTIAVTWRVAELLERHLQDKNISAQHTQQLSELQNRAEQILKQIQHYGDDFQQKADEGTVDKKLVENTFNIYATQSVECLLSLTLLANNIAQAPSLSHDPKIQILLEMLDKAMPPETPRMWL